ncbi:uncharacterized protein hemgn [Eucyclogobius newberryi]|uniref:uncharacterized protein hemgn n=1 Tax=Eucyclogobius newberryi TaxID=166745 RepID=UPI003B5B3AFB
MEESVQQESQPEPQPELQQKLQLEPFQEDQQEQPELENKNQNDQGDFRRRLRDRDLLKKRKAEAEEKETDEWDLGMESPKKRGRSAAKRDRRRGRPRKTDPPVITDSQRESVLDQDTPAALTQAALGQTPITVEAQVSDVTAAAPVFEELNPTVQAPATALEIAVDIPSIPVQYVASTAASTPLSMPPVTPEPMNTGPQSNPALDQCILIEDLGPDEEEDLCPSQDQQAAEDFSGKPIISAAEPTFFSIPTLSSPSPPQQEYVPRN